MLKFPTLDEVLSFHNRLDDGFGVKDWGALESIVNGHSPTWGRVDLKPSFSEKAAHYWCKFTQFHSFVNGNKRMGVIVLLDFLYINGYEHGFSHQELIDLSLAIAEGVYTEEEVAVLIQNNIH